MVISLTCSRQKQKRFFKPRFSLGHRGSRAKGAAEALDEASAEGRTLVMEWVSVWRSALPLRWRWALPWQ